MSEQRRRVQPQPAVNSDAIEPGGVPGRDSLSEVASPAADLAALRRLGEVVAEIGAALAIPPERLARAEALDRLELDIDVLLATFDTWSDALLNGWFAFLGADLRIDATLPGDGQASGGTVSLRSGHGPAQALADFLDAARQTTPDTPDDTTVSVRLAIAKARSLQIGAALLAQRPDCVGAPETLAHTKIAVFYSSAAFSRLIGMHALGDWERLGLAREDGLAVVVLCDTPGYLAGVALEVLGAHERDELRWLSLSRAGFRQFRQRAEQTRMLRDEEGSWAAAPRVLTPAHLRVESRAPGLDDIAARLAEFQAGLAATFLADSVHTSAHNDLVLHFAGARPATCRIPAKTATGDAAPSMLNPQLPAKTATGGEAPQWRDLARLAIWAYDNASADKLAVARECLAREVTSGGDVPLVEIEHAAAGALEAARANFTLYLRRNTEQYFSVRQKALDAVAEYSSAVRKAVSDLTGEVVDNVYRTAGLLVGVVIAGLIQPSLSLSVARLAAFLYVAYIAFLLAFFMRARWQRYELERASLEEHLAAMPELGASERGALRQRPVGAEAYFRAYFRRAWWIYAGLGAAGLLIFLLLWTPLAPLTGLPHSALPAPTHATGP